MASSTGNNNQYPHPSAQNTEQSNQQPTPLPPQATSHTYLQQPITAGYVRPDYATPPQWFPYPPPSHYYTPQHSPQTVAMASETSMGSVPQSSSVVNSLGSSGSGGDHAKAGVSASTAPVVYPRPPPYHPQDNFHAQNSLSAPQTYQHTQTQAKPSQKAPQISASAASHSATQVPTLASPTTSQAEQWNDPHLYNRPHNARVNPQLQILYPPAYTRHQPQVAQTNHAYFKASPFENPTNSVQQQNNFYPPSLQPQTAVRQLSHTSTPAGRETPVPPAQSYDVTNSSSAIQLPSVNPRPLSEVRSVTSTPTATNTSPNAPVVSEVQPQMRFQQPPIHAQSSLQSASQALPQPQPNVGHNLANATQLDPQPATVSAPAPSSQALAGKIDLFKMEQEMKEIFEKMRHYQNVDPQTFYSALENVKKSSSSAGAITAGAANLGVSPEQAENESPETVPAGIVQVGRAPVGTSVANAKVPRVPQDSLVQSQQVDPNIEHNRQLLSPPQPLRNSILTQPTPAAPAPQPTRASNTTKPPARAPATKSNLPQYVWTQSQKRAIAEVAVNFLTKSTGKSIVTETVMGLLEKPRNFVSLCENLEAMDFKFDRGKFARKLLESVEGRPKEIAKPADNEVGIEQGARVLGEVKEDQEQPLRGSNAIQRNTTIALPQQQRAQTQPTPRPRDQLSIQAPVQQSPDQAQLSNPVQALVSAPVQVPAHPPQPPAQRIIQSPQRATGAERETKHPVSKPTVAWPQTPQLTPSVPSHYPQFPPTPMSVPPMVPVAPIPGAKTPVQYVWHPPPMYPFPTPHEHNQFAPPHGHPSIYYYPYPPPQTFFHGPPQTPGQQTPEQYYPLPTLQGGPPQPLNSFSKEERMQPAITQTPGQDTPSVATGNVAVPNPSSTKQSLIVKLPLKGKAGRKSLSKGVRPDSEDEDPSFIDEDPIPFEPRTSPRPARMIPKEIEPLAPEPEADEPKRPRIVVVPGRIRRRTLSEMEFEAEKVVKSVIDIPARRKKSAVPVVPVASVAPVSPATSAAPVSPTVPPAPVAPVPPVKSVAPIVPMFTKEPSIEVGDIDMTDALDDGNVGDDEDDSDVEIGGRIEGGGTLAAAVATATRRRVGPSRTKSAIPIVPAAKGGSTALLTHIVGGPRRRGRPRKNAVNSVEATAMALDGIGGNGVADNDGGGNNAGPDPSAQGTYSGAPNSSESGNNTTGLSRAGGQSQQGFGNTSRRTSRGSSGLRNVATPDVVPEPILGADSSRLGSSRLGSSRLGSPRAESAQAESTRTQSTRRESTRTESAQAESTRVGNTRAESPLAESSKGPRRRQTFAVVIYTRPKGSSSTAAPSDIDYQRTAKKRRLDSSKKSTPGASDTDRSQKLSAGGLTGKTKSQRPPAMPQYRVYKCQWAECPAGLHNYETLRDHVLKVHRRQMVSGGYQCKWKGCYRPPTEEMIKAAVIKKIEVKNILNEFDDDEQWEAHVREHLVEVKNVFGLGPEGGFSDPEPLNSDVDFCSDAEGRKITPWVTPAPPGYHWTPPPGFRANEAFNSLHGIARKNKGRPSGSSTPGSSRVTDTAAYERELERARKLGAGMETNEADDLLEGDDGSGLFVEVRRVVNVEEEAMQEQLAREAAAVVAERQEEEVAAERQEKEEEVVKQVMGLSMSEAGSNDAEEEEAEENMWSIDEIPAVDVDNLKKRDKGKGRAVELSDEEMIDESYRER